jgi:hypothetical protein
MMIVGCMHCEEKLYIDVMCKNYWKSKLRCYERK